MKRYFLLFCMFINISLTADDANGESIQKTHAVLQKLESRISCIERIEKDIKGRTSVAFRVLSVLIIPGAALSCNKRTKTLGCLLLLVGFSAGVCECLNRFIIWPIKQKELGSLEKQKAELLKKLKEMQSK